MAGRVDPWPPSVWVAGHGVQITALGNKKELQFIVASDAIPGARLFRLFNDEGASEPRPFVVNDGLVLSETEPNDHFGKPMFIDTLPVSLNGRLDKTGDVDSFRVSVEAGQQLTASVESYVLMSKLDAVIRLVDRDGYQLAWNHDFSTIDPKVMWQADRDTDVIVQVFGFPFPATASVRLTGGEGAVYRLHLSVGDPKPTPKKELPTELLLPTSMRGFIEEPGASYRYPVQLEQGNRISVNVAAESLGSPLDAWLTVENSEGKELVRNDDANGSRDPALDWKAPKDGEFTLVVGSLTRNAGPSQYYELRADRSAPGWQVGSVSTSLAVKPGTTNEFKLTFTRLRGFTNETRILARNLPVGVGCEPVSVPEKGGEVTLKLVVSADAVESQGPIKLVAYDAVKEEHAVIPFKLTGTSVNNGVPGGYRVLLASELRHAWLTVLANEKTEPDDDEL